MHKNDKDIQIHDDVTKRSKRVQPTRGWLLNAAQIVPTPPAPRNGDPFLPFFGQAGPVDPLVGWRCCY